MVKSTLWIFTSHSLSHLPGGRALALRSGGTGAWAELEFAAGVWWELCAQPGFEETFGICVKTKSLRAVFKVITSQWDPLPRTARICCISEEGISAPVLIGFPGAGGSPAGRQTWAIAAEAPLGEAHGFSNKIP